MHAPFIFSAQQHASQSFPPPVGFILLLGVFWGGLMLATQVLSPEPWWPFQSPSAAAAWLLLSHGLPWTMMLSVQRPLQAGLWVQTLLLGALLGCLGFWAGTRYAPGLGLKTLPLDVPMGLSAGLIVLLLLPFLQAMLRHGRLRWRYADLFELAWQNVLVLLLSAVFIGIGALTLLLWALMFDAIGFDIFRRSFQAPLFQYPALGLLGGAGVAIARTQERPMQALRQILSALAKVLQLALAVACVESPCDTDVCTDADADADTDRTAQGKRHRAGGRIGSKIRGRTRSRV